MTSEALPALEMRYLAVRNDWADLLDRVLRPDEGAFRAMQAESNAVEGDSGR